MNKQFLMSASNNQPEDDKRAKMLERQAILLSKVLNTGFLIMGIVALAFGGWFWGTGNRAAAVWAFFVAILSATNYGSRRQVVELIKVSGEAFGLLRKMSGFLGGMMDENMQQQAELQKGRFDDFFDVDKKKGNDKKGGDDGKGK